MEKNSLKILYVTPRFHPFKGGAETNILAMARRMAKLGHDVTVFTTNVKFRNENLGNEANFNGIKIVRHWALNSALYAGFYPRLLPRLLRNQFDVIHVSGFGFMWAEFCLYLKRISSKHTVFINTPHGPFMALGDKAGFRGFAKSFYTRVLRFLVPRLYDAVIAVVPNQKEWMTKEYGIKEEKIFNIPNGIDESYIANELPEYSKKDKVVITYMNRMEWYKGPQDVVNALHRLKTRYKIDNFLYYIMGRPGGYTKKLQAMVEDLKMEDHIRFIYSPSDEERDRIFYEESQINILPSKMEGTGIVLLEAMAKGNAIVTTNQNEAVDVLINEKSGFSYNFGDIDALVKILKELISDYELRQNMIKNNLEFSKRFTWEAVFPRYIAMVEDLNQKKGSDLNDKSISK